MTSGFSSHRKLAKIKPHSGLSSQLAHDEPTRSFHDLHESSVPQAVGENPDISPRHYAPGLTRYPINTDIVGCATPTMIPVVNERNTLLQPLTDRYEQAIPSAQHIPERYGCTREPERHASLLQNIDKLFDILPTTNNSRSVPGSPESQPSSKADDPPDWALIDKREAAPDNTYASIAVLIEEDYSLMEAYLDSSFEDGHWVPRAALERAPYNPNSSPSEYQE